MGKLINYTKPNLYVHFKGATHFLSWELPYFKRYFNIVSYPSSSTVLLVFGPDALEEASTMPALKRFGVLFPGFGYNPLHNMEVRKRQTKIIKKHFETIFINPGPLELAYKGLNNITFYPFSVDTNLVKFKNYRKNIKSLLHVSNDGAQKDWQRSMEIMKKTGLPYLVYPPRDIQYYTRQQKINNLKNTIRKSIGIKKKNYLPIGYVNHKLVVSKYHKYDGFVHVAKEIVHPGLLDGKYTASLIEAGLTGSILFWHDTFNLGNSLETVFDLPVDTSEAANEIIRIKNNIDVFKHSKLTREEMFDTFNPEKSVSLRCNYILEKL